MIEYTKSILEKVSFNQELFLKEYKKAVLWLSTEEAAELKEWIRNKDRTKELQSYLNKSGHLQKETK